MGVFTYSVDIFYKLKAGALILLITSFYFIILKIYFINTFQNNLS